MSGKRITVYAILLALTFSCKTKSKEDLNWQPPDTAKIPATNEGRLIRYGRDLIANTAHYLGPKGTKAALSNGMNCQNCHLEAGTRKWGNNYAAVFSTYPRFRDRSGTIESVCRRINDCLERSLNGHSLDSSSREMTAILAYMKWLGQDVPKGKKPNGTGIRELPFLSRAADAEKGRATYMARCQRCHGAAGNGSLNADSTGYLYPPLWGEHSFTTGAGLFRLSRLAGLLKDNMPFDRLPDSTALTDEEAWDLAAFIDSRPRPEKAFPKDWPDIARKPVDLPFGPYADPFPTEQHKFGPFQPIQNARKSTPNAH